MSRYLLDTGIIIRHLRRDTRAAALLDRLADSGDLNVSAITVFEILRGCKTEDEERAVAGLFAEIRPIPIDGDAASVAARLAREHAGVFSSERSGLDAMIAGTAMEAEASLVTLNTRQFSRLSVPGLDLILVDQDAVDWAIIP